MLNFYIENHSILHEVTPLSFLSNMSTIVIAILLEAFPYVLLGVLISALLQTLVTDRQLQRWIPKKTIPGILFGCLLGILFPLCECGIIPVVHRLIRKGMPPYIGIVFMMAGPIINPIVILSTYEAFRGQPEMAVARVLLALAASVVIGLWASRGVRLTALRDPVAAHHEHAAASESNIAAAKPVKVSKALKGAKAVKAPKSAQTARSAKWHDALEHAAIELFDVGKFIVMGAIVTAFLQTAVSKDWLFTLSNGEWTPHLFMMGLAYLLSICSTADSFVGATFLPHFSLGSVLAFLVFGAMLDVKSTFMLLKVFRFKTVAALLGIAFVVVLLGSVAFDRLYLHLHL